MKKTPRFDEPFVVSLKYKQSDPDFDRFVVILDALTALGAVKHCEIELESDELIVCSRVSRYRLSDKFFVRSVVCSRIDFQASDIKDPLRFGSIKLALESVKTVGAMIDLMEVDRSFDIVIGFILNRAARWIGEKVDEL